MAETILKALLWILPGLLFLVVLILVISSADRRSRVDRSRQQKTPDTDERKKP